MSSTAQLCELIALADAAYSRHPKEDGHINGVAAFLRPNLFMQGLLGLAQSIKSSGQLFAAAEGRTYSLTGPESLTRAGTAVAISHAVGRTVTVRDVPPDAMRGVLLGIGVPPWQTEGLIEDYAHFRRGEAAAVMSGVQHATGQPPRPFSAFARDYAAAFS